MSRFYYFGYGSNLLQERIRLGNKSAEFVGTGIVEDHRLGFYRYSDRWKGATATIENIEGSQVIGCVWTMLNSDMENIDAQEGVPQNVYRPIELNVKMINPLKVDGFQNIKCRSYQIVDTSSPGLPSDAYKNVIVSGAKQNSLPDFYIEKLQKIESNGVCEVKILEFINNSSVKTEEEIKIVNGVEQ